MAPYTKVPHNSDEIDDAWGIRDGDGELIAILDTETMADSLLDCLLGNVQTPTKEYVEGWPYGEPYNEQHI